MIAARRNDFVSLLRGLAWVGLLALAACGGGSSGVADAGADAGPDLGVVVSGARLLVGDLDVKGVTTDGFVAVLYQAAGALAVPVAGGATQTVDPAADSAGVLGDAIFTFRHWDDVAEIGDLGVWTAAGGARLFAAASAGVLASSDDTTRLLATQNSSDDGTATDLVVGAVAGDGAAPTFVATISRDAACRARAAFCGGRFVVSHCDPGSESVTISSIDPVSGAAIPLLAHAKNQFAALPGPSGLVAVIAADGDAFFVPAAGGAMTPIGKNVDAAVVVADGSAVLLRAQGAITRVEVGGGASSTLVAAGVQDIWAVSPDGRSLLYRLTLGPRHGYGDLFLTSAAAPAATITLSKDVDATTFGDAFTRDGSRALYFADADDLLVGTLRSRAVTGDAAPATHGTRVWTTRGYADARVVFTSDYVPIPERPGRAVLRAVDTGSPDAVPQVLATFAGADFALTPARDAVVFSFNDGTERAGLYIAPLPGASSAPADAGVGDADVGDAGSEDGSREGPDEPIESPSDAGADVGDAAQDDGADAAPSDSAADGSSDSLGDAGLTEAAIFDGAADLTDGDAANGGDD